MSHMYMLHTRGIGKNLFSPIRNNGTNFFLFSIFGDLIKKKKGKKYMCEIYGIPREEIWKQSDLRRFELKSRKILKVKEDLND